MDKAQRDISATYQIVVQGKLDQGWAAWLDGMTISRTHAPDGTPLVVLSGPVADQAALRGLLARLWDLNLAVIGLRQTAPPGESERGSS